MIKRYSKLKTADESLDASFRKQALEAFDIFRAFLKREEDSYLKQFNQYLDSGKDPFIFHSTTLRENESVEGFQVWAKDIGIQENKYKLLFLIGTKNKIKNPALGWLNRIGEKVAILLFNNLISSYSLQYASTRISKEVFIHEFIHYLDAGRGNELGRETKHVSPEDVAFNWEKYFNNPSEMNAYYQENIDTLNNIVNNLVEANHINSITKMKAGFESFFKFAIRFFNQGWWQMLTPENKKRVQKRLYHFYETKKDVLGK